MSTTATSPPTDNQQRTNYHAAILRDQPNSTSKQAWIPSGEDRQDILVTPWATS